MLRRWAERTPAELKLLLLLALGIWAFTTRDLPLLAAATAVAGLSALNLRAVQRSFGLMMLVAIGPVVAFHLVTGDAEAAARTGMRFICVALAAAVMMDTTSLSRLLVALERACRPLALLGINPARPALALGMTVRFIPLLRERAQQTVEAQRARGIERGIMSLAVPLLVGSLLLARDVGDSLEARGIGDPPPPDAGGPGTPNKD